MLRSARNGGSIGVLTDQSLYVIILACTMPPGAGSPGGSNKSTEDKHTSPQKTIA
ncbi:MAG TPA: hypothetical protein VFF70_06330 [Anaerolineae bacterium]|nr:hypothetical protein [Anaerolineae bacterium]